MFDNQEDRTYTEKAEAYGLASKDASAHDNIAAYALHGELAA